jgi:hypothetical protein
LEQGGGQEGGAANDHKPSFPSVVPEVGAPLLTSSLSQPPPAQGGGKGAASEKLTPMGPGGEGFRRWALFAVLLLAACRPGPPPAPDVVARIGETEVRYSEFESYLARTAGDGETVLASDVLSQIFDQFLDEELLVRRAAERGLVRASAGGGVGGAGARRRAIDALLHADLTAQPGEPEIAAY